MALNTRELQALLENDPVLHFCGVRAYDQIPSKVERYPCGFVFNTHVSNKPGQHWISIYFSKNRDCSYLCSFGTDPFGALYDLIEANSAAVYVNKTLIQSFYSPVCGYYAAYHQLLSARGQDLKAIVDTFDTNRPLKNDILVQEYVHKHAQNLI